MPGTSCSPLLPKLTMLAVLGVAAHFSSVRAADPAPSTTALHGQRPSAATTTPAVILQEPTNWRLETLQLPPPFAPAVKLKGTEEIRFAPGMFDNTSSTYFTCILGLTIAGAPELGTEDFRDFLEQYYRGLSVNVGRTKGLTFDAQQMRATVEPEPSAPDTPRRFTASVIFFDGFTDGRKVTLNVEAVVVRRPAEKQTRAVLMVSPSGKDSEVWKDLRALVQRTVAKLSEVP